VATVQDNVGTPGGIHAFLNLDGAGGFVESSSGLPNCDEYYTGVATEDLDDDGDRDLSRGKLQRAPPRSRS